MPPKHRFASTSTGPNRRRLLGLNRRQFFARSAAALAGGALAAGTPFDGLLARSARAASGGEGRGVGYGPLSPAGDDLALPPGFQYRVISIEGEMMVDGFPVPKAMDGMGTFALPNGNVALVRNHEDNEAPNRLRPRPSGSTSSSDGILNAALGTDYGPRSFAYDTYAGGGTTTIEVEPFGQRRLVRQYWSLVGTLRNCAGGTTPWGSWLSCEETLNSLSASGFTKNHGYVFEVPSNTVPGTPAAATALTRLGRFAHEAVAVDPSTGIVYETEDQGDVSGLYRFVPATMPTAAGDLAAVAGTLEMLKVNSASNYETAIGQTVGVPLEVSWVAIGNPDPSPPTATVNGAAASAVFKQGYDGGGAIFRRLEGCWFDAGKLYFVSTNGGPMGMGQLWVLDPAAGTLTLLFESPGAAVLDFPDNITVSPRGGIVMCEDGAGTQFLRGISTSGEIFEFARNLRNTIEFAGACYSADGQTLFVNMYGRSTVRTIQPYKAPLQIPIGPEENEKARTVAIWGPWKSGLL